MNKPLFRQLLLAAIVLVMLLMALSWQLQHYLDKPIKLPETGLDYTLEKGGSLSTVVYSLAAQDRLQHPRVLTLYSRLTGRGASVAAGEYHFEAGLTPRGLLAKLERGDVRYYQLTLVEGWNLRQVLAALRSQPKLRQLIPANVDTLSAQWLGLDVDYPVLEGLLFPDTYRYHSATTDIDVLQQAYRRMQKVLQEEWQQRSGALPYDSPYQALIMASLIEKETGVASERAQIAGVFVRRLQKGMRLQTDPTIIYGLGNRFDGNLRGSHLKDASNPYNTYRHHGLPPTPIALAGREAIHAALHPAAGEALYFVAKGDGSHYFSKTLQEHQKAVRKYQIKQRRKDYSSAPGLKSSG